MDNRELYNVIKQVIVTLKTAQFAIITMLIFTLIVYSDEIATLFSQTKNQANTDALNVQQKVAYKNGIHVETGLIEASGVELVIQNCTSCHSAKLITQNKMNLSGWHSTIRWMQETQSLWDLVRT